MRPAALSSASRPARRSLLPALLALAFLFACNLNPPHFIGDETGRTGSESRRPAWIEDPFRISGGFVFVTGLSSKLPRKDEARQVAEADARNRLASAIEARIISDLEQEERTRGTLSGGRVTSSETSLEVRSKLRSLADVAVREATPVSEYFEEYSLFGKGWERRYDAWVLVKIPESEYRLQLDLVRRKGTGRGSEQR